MSGKFNERLSDEDKKKITKYLNTNEFSYVDFSEMIFHRLVRLSNVILSKQIQGNWTDENLLYQRMITAMQKRYQKFLPEFEL